MCIMLKRILQVVTGPTCSKTISENMTEGTTALETDVPLTMTGHCPGSVCTVPSCPRTDPVTTLFLSSPAKEKQGLAHKVMTTKINNLLLLCYQVVIAIPFLLPFSQYYASPNPHPTPESSPSLFTITYMQCLVVCGETSVEQVMERPTTDVKLSCLLLGKHLTWVFHGRTSSGLKEARREEVSNGFLCVCRGGRRCDR